MNLFLAAKTNSSRQKQIHPLASSEGIQRYTEATGTRLMMTGGSLVSDS
jgi:hypothetical protein